MAAAEESASIWLEAHEDPLAGLRSFPACMALADLHGDGDHKLVVGVPRAGGGPRLAVVGGAGAITTLALPEAPAGVGVLGPPLSAGGGSGGGAAPSLLVAAGPSLYVYRNLRPFYKYSLPPRAPHPLERDLWLQADQDELDPLMLKEMLEDLRDKAAVTLTARSLRLLALPPPELGPFVALHKGRPLHHQPVVSCLGALPRGGPEGTPACPVLGTEGGDVLLLDPEAFTLLCQGWVPSPPAFVAPRGGADGRFRLAVAARDGNVYGISRSRARGRALAALGAPPLGLLAQPGGGLVAATAQGTLLGLSPQGRRLWSVQLPGGVTALAGGSLPGRGLGATLVALENREVRLYRGRTLLCLLRTQEVVTGLCFGRYGREENTLLCTARGGALSIRMLRRRAELGPPPGARAPPGPAPPLPLPPRSRLFRDRALREREEAARIHGRFQRDVGGLRLGAARGLARALGGGAGTPPGGGGPPITLTASVQGLGPRLRLTLRLLLPGGGPPSPDLLLLLRCHPPPKSINPPCIKVPLLLPGLSFVVGTWLEPGGGTPGRLQVLLLRRGGEAPLLTAQVGLPLPP